MHCTRTLRAAAGGTWRLRPTSPAIGAAVLASPSGLGATDLAGLPRLVGGKVDQGAFAFHPTTLRVPVVAHTTGFGGTPWRSAVALVNGSQAEAEYPLSFASAGKLTPAQSSLATQATIAYPDVVVDPLGFPASARVSGSLAVGGGVGGAVIASRTFADPGGGTGTYGQYYPALAEDELLAAGETAVLPLPRHDGSFYTNIGFQNLGRSGCQVELTLHGADGVRLGSPLTQAVPAGGWAQINDAFARAGAGSAAAAYAMVRVLEPTARVWAYASVVDASSRDPTTVPVALPWVGAPPLALSAP